MASLLMRRRHIQIAGKTKFGTIIKKKSSRNSPAGVASVQQAFSALDEEARKVSQLNDEVSKLHSTSQKLMDVTKFHFCVPIKVLKNSLDVTLALARDSIGLLKRSTEDTENIEFELVGFEP